MNNDNPRIAALVIADKSQLYAGAYLFGLIACMLLYITPPWFAYVAGTLVLACAYCAFQLRRIFKAMTIIHNEVGYRDIVLANHLKMNGASLALLAYAWLAIIRNWPAPWLAVLCAFILNFFHYYGYAPKAQRGAQ